MATWTAVHAWDICHKLTRDPTHPDVPHSEAQVTIRECVRGNQAESTLPGRTTTCAYFLKPKVPPFQNTVGWDSRRRHDRGSFTEGQNPGVLTTHTAGKLPHHAAWGWSEMGQRHRAGPCHSLVRAARGPTAPQGPLGSAVSGAAQTQGGQAVTRGGLHAAPPLC